MHKPDPVNDPDIYEVAYIGQGNSYKFKGFPWYYHRKKRLLERSGSEKNVYVAVCYFPESQRMDRRKVERALVDKFGPFLNE